MPLAFTFRYLYFCSNINKKEVLPMKLLEAFSEGKYSDAARCEDGWCVTEGFAAVVDGSTSKAAKSYSTSAPCGDEETTGHKAMCTVLESIKALPAETDMQHAAQILTASLAAANTPESLRHPALRCTCSAVIFSRARHEVWLFGDCQCRFGGRTYTNGKYVDEVLTRIRCDVNRYLLAHGYDEDELRRHDMGRAIIYNALREQTAFQNDGNVYNPYRYAVLDGTPIDVATVPVLHVDGEETLVLASDGFPVVCDTLTETETALQRLLLTDPLCIAENAGTKGLMQGQWSFDDRTFIKVEI